MKTKRFILTAIAVLAGTVLAMGATNEVSALLQKGLFEEEANRNLDAAIQEYQAVVTQTDKDRQFAATAIFRLGECYRKQGKTNEANEQYRRVLREFPDQTELAKLSREYVGPGEAAALASNPEGVPSLQSKIAAAQAEIETHKRELDELTEDRSVARVYAQQHFPNPVLTSLMQHAVETEQELARLKESYSDQHPSVLQAQETLKTLDGQIDAQLKPIRDDVKAKLSDALATLSDLRKRAAEAPKVLAASTPQEQAPAKPSEEDQTIRRLQGMLRDSPDLINAYDSLGMTPLNSAVRSGQMQVVKFLLDNKANIETRDGSTFTPLLSAAESEHRDIVELLLDRGADVNVAARADRDQRFSSWPIYAGYTALHYAAGSGNKAIAELLLAHGATVDARDGRGATPLMVAVDKGFKTVADMLIARGADVNARNNDGKSPLVLAIEKDRPSIIELLLANKADVNLASQDGYTPLIAAVNASQPDTVKVLLEHGADARAQMADTHASTPRWTALDAAVVMNDNISLKLLLENHADPNATFDLSESGRVYERDSTPLILAVEHQQTDCAAILLAHGANVNGRNAEGRTALWQAALSKNYRAMAELLLNNKADTEIKYERGQTVLQLAVIYGKTEMVELLLARGANINAQNDDGQTALLLAANAGARPIVELLLAHGADVNLKDKQGNTALDLAKDSGGTGLVPAPAPPMFPHRPTTFPGGSTPLTYQWTVNGGGRAEGQEGSNSIAALLRQHGALAEVDISTIRITRQGVSSASIVFRNGADSHNHFTMFDLIAQVYAPPNWDPWQSDPWQSGKLGSEPPGLRFPDLSKIKIVRLGAGGSAKTVSVDLEAAMANGDCGRDVALEWGDIVEIPEADHKVNEHWNGLDEAVRATLKKCLQSTVIVVVKGQTNQVTLTPDVPFYGVNMGLSWHGSRPELSGPSAKTELWTFWLNEVVHQANVILYSSDLTRVKVKRAIPETHKSEEMVFNLEKNPLPHPPGAIPGNDLRLRDGDVIEIPEKQ